MKKLICFLIPLLLLLCSCGANEKKVISGNLSFNFDFTYNKSEYSVSALVSDNGDITYTVLKPENIKGLKFNFTENTLSTEFLGLKKDYPIAHAGTGVLSRVHTAFRKLAINDYIYRDGKFIVSNNGEDYIFFVTELGIPIALELSGEKIEFKNIKEE